MRLAQPLTEEWLEAQNEKYAEDDIPPIRRPFLALREWAMINKIAVPFSSAPAKHIFKWFEANNKPGSHLLSHLFTGAFYFDSCFWQVVIPMGFGSFKINAFKALDNMSDKIKLRLASSREHLNPFLSLWADCADYAYGLDRLRRENRLNQFCLDMLMSGDKELKATIALLLEDKPNPKAIETARLATEMFLKAFLANKTGLTDKEARNIGHNLEVALDKCLEAEDHQDLKLIRIELNSFPKIEERYKATRKTTREMWRAYDLAQFTGATIVRSFTGHDIRPLIKYEPVPPKELQEALVWNTAW
jgi:hypothetical protein